MRGKHKRAAATRQHQGLATQVAQLEQELTAERRRAEQAAELAALTRAARAELAQLQARVERRLAADLEVEARRGAALKVAGEQLAQALQAVRQTNAALSGGRDSHELAVSAGEAGMRVRYPAVHTSSTVQYARTWYRKQTGSQLPETVNVTMQGWVPDDLGVELDELAPYALSTALGDGPEAWWEWAIPPWMRIPTDTSDAPDLRAELGAHTSGAPHFRQVPFPGPRLPRSATITTPWRHCPLIASPADAADLAYWYHRSAFAQNWRTENRPVPFLLPAEYSTTFADAQPLPDGVELHLPFPLLFARFNSPWQISPAATAAQGILTQPFLLMHARGEPAAETAPPQLQTVLQRLQATGLDNRDMLPTPLRTLDVYGGQVEGLLLAADSDGQPVDEFAWCIAIGSPFGLPLGRIVVPARRSHARWGAQVANIITAVALSTWHRTSHTSPATRVAPAGSAEIAAEGADVHVLDIGTTASRTSGEGKHGGQGQVAPHLRRGHWRRQHIGAHRATTKWTWVRPTSVHGGPASINQIYRLPRRSDSPS